MQSMKLPIILLAGASLLWSAPDELAQLRARKSDLEMQIERTRKSLAEEEKSWAEEKQIEEEAEKKRKERYESFAAEKQELQAGIVHTETAITERMAHVESLKNRDANINAQIRFLRSVILEKAREFETLVQNGFPYRTEKRLETARLLVDDLVKERISPEEGFNRLWVLYTTEHTLASDAEIYSGTALIGAQDVSVKYMRVGKQILAYTTSAGDKLGMLVPSRNGGFEWLREEGMDYRTRVSLRDAIAVAEGKAVPGFVEFPFPGILFPVAEENAQ